MKFMDESIYHAVDFQYLLLENYKKLNITEQELAVIFMINHLLDQGNHFITQELLSLKMTLSLHEIDQALTSLIQKKLLEYENVQNEMRTTLEPLKKRVFREFELTFLKRRQESLETGFDAQVQNIYSVFEKELGRTLSPAEFQKIHEWVSFGYEDDFIISALREAISENKRSIRAVDRILLKRTTRDDMQKEGYSAVNHQWNQDIEKTIAIASEKWIEDDEKGK